MGFRRITKIYWLRGQSYSMHKEKGSNAASGLEACFSCRAVLNLQERPLRKAPPLQFCLHLDKPKKSSGYWNLFWKGIKGIIDGSAFFIFASLQLTCCYYTIKLFLRQLIFVLADTAMPLLLLPKITAHLALLYHRIYSPKLGSLLDLRVRLRNGLVDLPQQSATLIGCLEMSQWLIWAPYSFSALHELQVNYSAFWSFLLMVFLRNTKAAPMTRELQIFRYYMEANIWAIAPQWVADTGTANLLVHRLLRKTKAVFPAESLFRAV